MNKKQNINYNKWTLEQLTAELKRREPEIIRYTDEQRAYSKARDEKYRRLVKSRQLCPQPVKNAGTAENLWKLTEFLGALDKEKFIVICCDKTLGVITVLSESIEETDSRAVVDPDRIIADILRHKGKIVYFAHNHCDGNLVESYDDCCLTESLRTLCRENSIELADHLIVGKDHLYSMGKRKNIY